jgi:hypothetical protein
MSDPEVVIAVYPGGDVELMPFGFPTEEAALAATLPYRVAFGGAGELLSCRQVMRGRSALAGEARAFRARMLAWLQAVPSLRFVVEYAPDEARVLAGLRFILSRPGRKRSE